jgi:hypothetical protein
LSGSPSERLITAMLLIASVATLMPLVANAEESPLPDRASPEAGRDRLEIRDEGDATVVDVYHVNGIGGAKVTLPTSGPQAVVFRFHDFPALESLTARSQKGEFKCMVIRPEGVTPQTICQLDGVRVDAIEESPGLIEVRLPAALLDSPGARAKVRWVDQWR